MAEVKDAVGTPEAETSEQRTREQLKKASITSAASEAQPADTEAMTEAEIVPVAETNGDKSTEYLGEEAADKVADKSDEPTAGPPETIMRHHTRKRSRDSTAEEDQINNGQRKSSERIRMEEEVAATANGAPKTSDSARPRTPEAVGDKRGEGDIEAMASPRTKRSRLHVEPKEVADSTDSSKDAAPPTTADTKPATTIPPTSGFANTSASSPFAALASPKSPDAAQTTNSAFTSSAFGSLAGSTTSGFGAIGKPSGGFGAGGSFATSPKKPETAAKQEPASAFGGSLGQTSVFSSAATTLGGGSSSGFGGAASGFGGIGQGNAFGGSGFSSLGGVGGLTSFASGKGGPSSKATTKPFGAPPAENEEPADEEAGDDDAGFKSPLSQESDRQDDRFYAQDLETGEEDEKTQYSCRAKLYNFVANEEGKKEWKERGLGTVRLNVKLASTKAGDVEAQEETTEEADDDSKLRARLLMRAEGSYRVILNTPIKKELKFGTPSGGPPQGGYLYFMGTVEGKQGLEMLQMKVRQQFAMELYEKILALQESM